MGKEEDHAFGSLICGGCFLPLLAQLDANPASTCSFLCVFLHCGCLSFELALEAFCNVQDSEAECWAGVSLQCMFSNIMRFMQHMHEAGYPTRALIIWKLLGFLSCHFQLMGFGRLFSIQKHCFTTHSFSQSAGWSTRPPLSERRQTTSRRSDAPFTAGGLLAAGRLRHQGRRPRTFAGEGLGGPVPVGS